MKIKLEFVKQDDMRYAYINIEGTKIESKEEVVYLGNVVKNYIDKYMGTGYSRIGKYESEKNSLAIKMVLGSQHEQASIDNLYKELRRLMSVGNSYVRTIGAIMKDRVADEYLRTVTDKEKETLFDYVQLRAEQARMNGTIVH